MIISTQGTIPGYLTIPFNHTNHIALSQHQRVRRPSTTLPGGTILYKGFYDLVALIPLTPSLSRFFWYTRTHQDPQTITGLRYDEIPSKLSAGAGTLISAQLQPDPNEGTAALLRVLIHKIYNTTFVSNTPTLPQWDGPPHAIVHVQAILSASLTASLFSVFLAVLGKQWLNRYDSTERCCRMDVIESLPLILQAALLFLGCALSRWIWDMAVKVHKK